MPDHGWLQEVLEDLVTYAKLNGLMRCQSVLEQAYLIAEKEMADISDETVVAPLLNEKSETSVFYSRKFPVIIPKS